MSLGMSLDLELARIIDVTTASLDKFHSSSTIMRKNLNC